jgi:hypothetical protein
MIGIIRRLGSFQTENASNGEFIKKDGCSLHSFHDREKQTLSIMNIFSTESKKKEMKPG